MRRIVVGDRRRYEDVDPAAVWTLLADPSRIGEWAGVETVGYMGTELPAVGHIVFIKTGRFQKSAGARRVVVESWDAGTGFRCKVDGVRVVGDFVLEVRLTSEVGHAARSALLEIRQAAEVPRRLEAVWRAWASHRVKRMLDRVGRRLAR